MSDRGSRSPTAIYRRLFPDLPLSGQPLRRPNFSCLDQRLPTPLQQFRLRHLAPGRGRRSCRPPPTRRRVAVQAAPDTALGRPQGPLGGSPATPGRCCGLSDLQRAPGGRVYQPLPHDLRRTWTGDLT
jgi:hypothetical protein